MSCKFCYEYFLVRKVGEVIGYILFHTPIQPPSDLVILVDNYDCTTLVCALYDNVSTGGRVTEDYAIFL